MILSASYPVPNYDRQSKKVLQSRSETKRSIRLPAASIDGRDRDRNKHSLELIQEYWNTNQPTELTPKITSHYVKAVWEPMEVSTTPCEASAAPDDFWEPYDDEEYDSSSSEVDYFPIYNDGLLWHQEDDEESKENWERIWYF